ncbi:MAG: hypothetical protein OXH67_02835 [Acidimicrobiaceae bacterium]|nr:hypothetical protein [Acidimicrobiaceae bacterium]MDE0664503.1 hypothetical protein [Acidimicrobiaceae bacterium]MYE57922.1 hypothetical protein [Acidimicrobiaceae bacterium]
MSADPDQRRRLEMVERYTHELVANRGAVDDDLTLEMQQIFTKAEFSDLLFTICYHIGMQYVGRAMHWDDACPVPWLREAVEAAG